MTKTFTRLFRLSNESKLLWLRRRGVRSTFQIGQRVRALHNLTEETNLGTALVVRQFDEGKVLGPTEDQGDGFTLRVDFGNGPIACAPTEVEAL